VEVDKGCSVMFMVQRVWLWVGKSGPVYQISEDGLDGVVAAGTGGAEVGSSSDEEIDCPGTRSTAVEFGGGADGGRTSADGCTVVY
jgi:hypothetical protein